VAEAEGVEEEVGVEEVEDEAVDADADVAVRAQIVRTTTGIEITITATTATTTTTTTMAMANPTRINKDNINENHGDNHLFQTQRRTEKREPIHTQCQNQLE